MEREYQFLDGVDVSVLAQRRVHAPSGLSGGAQGLPGDQWLLAPDGQVLAHPFDTGRARAGERLRVFTPGGGGFGPRIW